MANILVLKYNAAGKKEKHTEGVDSIKFSSFLTANYELTDSKLGHLVDGSDAADEHIHDARYYRENEYVATSAGGADAAKPILLDSEGNIDASMLNDADIAHDSTSGAAASTVHTAFPLLVGGRDFTAIQEYDTHKTFTTDTSIVDKKYVDDEISSTVTLGEWQDSVIDIQTDDTLDPTLTIGYRYILEDISNLHANFGTITGVANDDIVEWDGSAFFIANSPTVGTRVGSDANTNSLYFFSGSAWVPKSFESTTASLGAKKVAFDIQADIQASSGIKLVGNSMAIEPNDFAGSGLIDDGSDNLAIDWSTTFDDAKAIKASDLGSTSNALGASIIGIEDSLGLFDAVHVESALAEVMAQAKEGSGIDYISGAGGVSKGDLVYISAANTVLPFSTLTSDVECCGLALETKAVGEIVKVARFDTLMVGALTAANPNDEYYWDGSAFTTTESATTDENVWKVGMAKNATDLAIHVEHLYKNA